jgi:predicted RNA binding protein YcfA (HicA-like mRNA interferase family)
MAIGKNAIKRVENNGYSKVKTNAPDMENSHVIANISEEVMEKIVAPVEKKTAAKKPAAKKPAAKKATVKKVEKDGFERVEVGTEMPYYLL